MWISELRLTCQIQAGKSDLEGRTYTHLLVRLTHPEVVHGADGPLEALADLHVDVLVEAGSHGAEGRQRGPVILPSLKQNARIHEKKKTNTFFQNAVFPVGFICIATI